MNVLSLLLPGRRGLERGLGRAALPAIVLAEATDDGGGDRKPPACGEAISVGKLAVSRVAASTAPSDVAL